MDDILAGADDPAELRELYNLSTRVCSDELALVLKPVVIGASAAASSGSTAYWPMI
jgi:hypothetical protein